MKMWETRGLSDTGTGTPSRSPRSMVRAMTDSSMSRWLRITRTACSMPRYACGSTDIVRYAANGAARSDSWTTAGRSLHRAGQSPDQRRGSATGSPSCRSAPSRSSCHTDARNGHDHSRRVREAPSTFSVQSRHSSTSRKIEWLRLPNSTAGFHSVTGIIAWLPLVVSGDRSPLHSQPMSCTGGRDPVVPTGGSGSSIAAVISASAMPSDSKHPASRAR
jgi:hypothetical protein